MKVSRELEEQILRMPGTTVNGLPVTAEILANEKVDGNCHQPIESSVISYGNKLVITLGIKTVSEANKSAWKGKSNRTRTTRLAVSQLLGKNLLLLWYYAKDYHAGKSMRVSFTRVGGRKLDAANLPTSMKATEDAVALMMGANDGDPRWHSEFHQKPGGSRYGVVIEMEIINVS